MIYNYFPLPGPTFAISDHTFPYGINNAGLVVGSFVNLVTEVEEGFVYSNGSYGTVYVPNSIGTVAQGINDSNQIVGYYTSAPGGAADDHGFIYNSSSNSFLTLDDPLGVGGTRAYGINNAGSVVGVYTDANGHTHGFLYNGTDGSYTTLDDPQAIGSPPGVYAPGTFAQGINNSGQIVGYYNTPTSSQFVGFLYSNGTYTTIPVPGELYGLNDLGQIVGSGTSGGFFYSGGVVAPLPAHGGPPIAFGVNNSGQIVGYVQTSIGVSGFTATPVTGQVVLTSVAEGQPTTEPVATFTDPYLIDTAFIFTATVNWGDGTTEAGTITGANGSFAVTVPGSTHVYADAGTYTTTVTITDTNYGTQIAPTGTVTVTDAPLDAAGTAISGIQGIAISNATVATFTDGNPYAAASDFTATINWGDGTTTTGTVVAQNGGGFAVDGAHAYTHDGQYAGNVTINDLGAAPPQLTLQRGSIRPRRRSAHW
jgi:probable HAF family extracellular repeat protein